ncbi:MAG: methionine synthase [Acidimicrobiales bacterium]|nr:methionine synthase [Acidimicrobiales bacterium]
MTTSFLDLIAERVVVYDGAFGTYVQTLPGLTADDFGGEEFEGCNEMLAVTRPDVIQGLHETYFSAGCDVTETATFGAFAVTLNEYDIAHRAHELNVEAAKIAKNVATDFATDGSPRFVAGSIGPGTKMPTLGHITYRELLDAYEVQAVGLLEGGVDLFLIETQNDLLTTKAAINGCRRAMKSVGREVPFQVQVTIELTGTMLPGTEIGAALATLDPMDIDIVGLNCATGPGEMSEHLRYLSQHSRMPVSALPNAGLPKVVDGEMVYDLTPEGLLEAQTRFITEYGIQVVGGCCGTNEDHIRLLAENCKDLTPAKREPEHVPGAASIYSFMPIEQDASIMLIGERTNANGSKAFREAMVDGDWDATVKMLRDQIAGGAHVIDVCVDYVGRDGTEDMAEIASRFATQSTAPLMIDSTEPEVVETALELLGGRPILNSVNLEDGDAPGTRFDRFFTLAREHGAAVVCTCIDEEGQARTPEWKLRAAKSIHDIAVEKYGLEPSDLIFDPLALTLGTGLEESRQDGLNTLEGIKLIKENLPGVHTTLGLSNISFGLKASARHVLNSVYLDEAAKAGLDSAIVHAGKIVPLARIPEDQRDACLDLIYDRRGTEGALAEGDANYDPLSKVIELFADVESVKEIKEDRSDWPVADRLEARIIDGDRDGLVEELDEALDEGIEPLDIINNHLLAGMKIVGDRFGSGEMQLPFVLQSAETMKTAVAHLENFMEKNAEDTKGRIVLATVKGDVHDIGKNLVDIILTNNGYDVFNLGIKVPISDMMKAVDEVDAHAVGMSGLLVKSTLIMRENLEELNSQDLDIPILLGGAALTRSYVERDLREVYEGRLFYGKDAFEGLYTMDRLLSIRTGGEDDDPEWGVVPSESKVRARAGVAEKSDEPEVELPDRSPEVVTDNPIPTPPFWGSQVVKGVPLDDIAGYVNETALFRNQWQFRPETKPDGDKETDAEFKDRIRPQFRAQLAEAKADGLLQPMVVYGYFPANGDGNDVVIWTDETATEERCRFSYPRQKKEPFLCIADMFRPIDSGEVDVAAFHIVTMGPTVSERCAELFAADKYQDYLMLHGIGVEMAEALAELWHRRIREELGIDGDDADNLHGLFRQHYHGGRYSWGYPACPDLEDNEKVADLLGADRLGIEVSEETGFQYQPEQTTSAIICHHPRAKYFIAR